MEEKAVNRHRQQVVVQNSNGEIEISDGNGDSKNRCLSHLAFSDDDEEEEIEEKLMHLEYVVVKR